MSEITIKSKSLQVQGELKSENILVSFNYSKDEQGNALNTVNGQVNLVDGQQQTYIGNFFGNADGQGVMRYNFNDIRNLDYMDEIVAIAKEIEAYAKDENV
jgi:hypothetical protein